MRIVLHLYVVYDSFVVLTNGTDALVVLLQYCAKSLRMKLKNLYIKIGVGTSTQYLSVHELVNILAEI